LSNGRPLPTFQWMALNVPTHAAVPPSIGWGTRVATLVRPRIGTLYLSAAGAIVGAAIMWVGRGEWFFADEWAFIVGRRGWTADTFLTPHAEHVVALPVLVYKGMFAVVGLNAYWPYRALMLFVHLACVWLVFRLARSRIGDPAAALAASFLLSLGSAWEVLLFPFEITLLGSVAFGLLALDVLGRRSRRGDMVAMLALIGAACSSSAGVAFLVGVAVELSLRRSWRRLWIAATPAVLFVAWWLRYGRAATGRDHLGTHVYGVPGYVFQSVQSAVAAAVPLTQGSVRLVVMLVALLVVVRIVRNREVLTPRLGGVVAAALTFWTLTGLARSGLAAGGNRYFYFGVVFMLLAAAELLRGMRFDRRIGVVVCVVLAASAVANLRPLEAGGAYMSAHGMTLRAELTALSQLDAPPPAGFHPDPAWNPNLTSDTYLAAAHDLRSPVENASDLRAAPEDVREAVDRVLLRAVPPTVRTDGAARCPGHSTSVDLRPHARRILVTSATALTVSFRLFAAQFQRSGSAVVEPGRHAILLPAIRDNVGWHVQVGAGGRICS
jgi:hypothetical protein